MTRSELIWKLSRELDEIPYQELELLVKLLFERVLTGALGRGRRIEIRGFGSFTPKFMPPKLGRNPKKGEKVQVEGRYTVHFKPGKMLKNKVNKALGSKDE